MGNERGTINVSVVNIYREATYRSEIINQGLMGESIIIEKKGKDFSKIFFLMDMKGGLVIINGYPS